MRTVTLIPGDGIGPEVTRAVVRILAAAGFTPEWETFSAGAEAVSEHGTTLPQALLDSIARHKIALKGPITTPVGKGFTSVNVGLRKALDLYANAALLPSPSGRGIEGEGKPGATSSLQAPNPHPQPRSRRERGAKRARSHGYTTNSVSVNPPPSNSSTISPAPKPRSASFPASTRWCWNASSTNRVAPSW